MIEIRRNWSKLTIHGRVEFMGKVITNQEKVPAILPHADPRLADFKALYLVAKEKDDGVIALEGQIKAARMARTEAVDAAIAAMGPNASFVEADATSEAMVLEVGYELNKAAPTPVGPLGPVQDLDVKPGDNDGELVWNVHPLTGASGYESRTTTDPNNPALWITHMVVTQSSGTIHGLTSGVRHYVQVRAIGPLGPGPWSDIAWRMVP
ncbi:MAG: fibronectin type III domain-containing protein [Chthoniobacteraceae bacterium]